MFELCEHHIPRYRRLGLVLRHAALIKCDCCLLHTQAARARAFGFSNEALKTITGEQAWREYGLTSSDVRHLPCMHRLGVVFDSSDVTRLYNKFEVQDACLRKFGSEVAGNWLKHGGRGVASQLEAAVPQQDPDAKRPVVATQR